MGRHLLQIEIEIEIDTSGRIRSPGVI